MGDEDARSAKNRFKSKWGKVFKESDQATAAAPTNKPLQFSDDVADFLKPSIEKAAMRPKIDIALAKRFPDAVEQIRNAGGLAPGERAWIPLKPRRREGLGVGFARTEPEVMGEGGDDAPDPPSEISRRRVAIARSRSESKPYAIPGALEPTTASIPPPTAGQTQVSPPSSAAWDQPRRSPPKRSNTSHQEFSPPVQARMAPRASPPDTSPGPWRLNRAPTGFGSEDSSEYEASPVDPAAQAPPMPALPVHKTRPVIDTRFDFEDNQGSLLSANSWTQTPRIAVAQQEDSRSQSPRSPYYAASLPKRRSMRANEGAALRRLSGMNFLEKGEELDIDPEIAEFKDNGFPDPEPNALQPKPPPSSALSPQSAMAPARAHPMQYQEPNRFVHNADLGVPYPSQVSAPPTKSASPFDDPKYVNRRSREGVSPKPAAHDLPLRDRSAMGPSGSQSPSLHPSWSNGTSASPNQFPPSSRSSNSSREDVGLRNDNTFSAAPSSQSRGVPMSTNPQHLAKPPPSPYARNPSPADYFASTRQPPSQPPRSPLANLRARGNERPGSAGSDMTQRPPPSPLLTLAEGNASATAALADFSARVAHMKGVFRLTAEKEQPADRCSPSMWLRTAIWWFFRGRFGLDEMLRQRQRQSLETQSRELLTQAHVDLAKTWWILHDLLGLDEEVVEENNLPAPQSGEGYETTQVKRSGLLLRNHLRSVCLAMGNKRVMPPHQSLIQGQDTRIWLEYPRFTPDATAVLSGQISRAPLIASDARTPYSDPLESLPFADSTDSFSYGRFAADAYINTDEAETDRVVLPCVVSMTRGRRVYQSSIVIASQNDLVNVKISPSQGEDGTLSWHDVSWRASASGMTIRLPRGFDLSVRMSEPDFRGVWNFVEYTRRIDHGFQADSDERQIYETSLIEAQYADSSNPTAFPQGNVKDCRVVLFEKSDKVGFGGELRRAHRGFRLLLATEPSHKTLSVVTHELGRSSPFFFEFRTDPTASGVALIVKIRESNTRQCRMLLVFSNDDARRDFFDTVNGMHVAQDETIVTKLPIASLNIEPATQTEGFSAITHPALQQLSWQKLGVTNLFSDDPTLRVPPTILSTSLRIVARHNNGSITDRLNLGKGELMLRLPCVAQPAIQFLRQPQEDVSMSVDARHAPPPVVGGTTELHRMIREQPTIRTFTFGTPNDLHDFQLAVTGMWVKFDGLAATFGIARRRMVVPIYKKWEATRVRIQIIANAQNTVTQVLAFMEGFSHADAMVFQVKKTDDFESSKGDSKGKKWSVKLKDAKFSLSKENKGEVDHEERVKQRFVNLEGMEYMEEHDDITVGFDTEDERDRFAQALPAATTVGRGLTLKRRI
ncbi:hypothetical protein K431DRAFT_219967 [Polychaeton citri CBS 116435]|uniref:Uncharacterized protein n=1 Tax=Polychaeton citri CBS 116435 TaxID=1314669 RepID=A0A9P4QC92_9PEZI|nr:hypothetical protein K431DRAFT_219967 [Polychaeton citri CBS 116435]